MVFRVVRSNSYDIGFGGLEALHPFDGRKFSKAWMQARSRQPTIQNFDLQVWEPAGTSLLELVHTTEYLAKTKNGAFVGRVLELPVPDLLMLGMSSLVTRLVVTPMRWAVAGTVLATREALDTNGLAVNIGGGFHHASSNEGSGFCLFSDIPIAIKKATVDGHLCDTSKILIIDLDAHQGNGFERALTDDSRVVFVDAFNEDIFPRDFDAMERIDHPVKLKSGIQGDEYLASVDDALSTALDRRGFDVAFYIAGTDIARADQLGRLDVSPADVLRRDVMVAQRVREKNIPLVVVTGGGYSEGSGGLIASMITSLCDYETKRREINE